MPSDSPSTSPSVDCTPDPDTPCGGLDAPGLTAQCASHPAFRDLCKVACKRLSDPTYCVTPGPTLQPTHQPSTSTPSSQPTAVPTLQCSTRQPLLNRTWSEPFITSGITSPVDSAYADRAGAMLGRSVAISRDGTTLVMGESDFGKPELELNHRDSGTWVALNTTTRRVRIYTYDPVRNSGLRKGRTLVADGTAQQRGQSVSINADGTVLALGDGTGGAVAVYSWSDSDSDWTAASRIDGSTQGVARNALFGSAVSLSADGQRIAIGAPGLESDNDAVGRVSSGEIFVYDISQGSVLLFRATGTNRHDHLGMSVSLSPDGVLVAGGACAGHCAYPLNLHSQYRVYNHPSAAVYEVGERVNQPLLHTYTGWVASIGNAGDAYAVAIGTPNRGPNCTFSAHIFTRADGTTGTGAAWSIDERVTSVCSGVHREDPDYRWPVADFPPARVAGAQLTADAWIDRVYFDYATSISVSSSSDPCELFVAVGHPGPDPIEACAEGPDGEPEWCRALDHTAANVQVFNVGLTFVADYDFGAADTFDRAGIGLPHMTGIGAPGNAALNAALFRSERVQVNAPVSTFAAELFSYPMQYGSSVGIALADGKLTAIIGAPGWTHFSDSYRPDPTDDFGDDPALPSNIPLYLEDGSAHGRVEVHAWDLVHDF